VIYLLGVWTVHQTSAQPDHPNTFEQETHNGRKTNAAARTIRKTSSFYDNQLYRRNNPLIVPYQGTVILDILFIKQWRTI
jgi:hypothetical protein